MGSQTVSMPDRVNWQDTGMTERLSKDPASDLALKLGRAKAQSGGLSSQEWANYQRKLSDRSNESFGITKDLIANANPYGTLSSKMSALGKAGGEIGKSINSGINDMSIYGANLQRSEQDKGFSMLSDLMGKNDAYNQSVNQFRLTENEGANRGRFEAEQYNNANAFSPLDFIKDFAGGALSFANPLMGSLFSGLSGLGGGKAGGGLGGIVGKGKKMSYSGGYYG